MPFNETLDPQAANGMVEKWLLEVEGAMADPSADGSTGLSDVALDVRAGEIVGIAGVSGNGQDELVEAVAGLRRLEAGRISIAGTDLTGASPAAMRAAGVAHIAADRMHVGLNLQATLEENAVSTSFRSRRFSRIELDGADGADLRSVIDRS